MRKGRFSKKEIKYIKENVKNMSSEDMAEHLDRDPASVDEFIKREFKVGLSSEEEAAYQLEARPYWVELKQQFSQQELELFKYHWTRVISQFKDDVIPTEEIQVVDLIKLELLMNRCLKLNKSNMDQINVFEELVRDERALDPDQQDVDTIINLERQVASLRAAQESLNRDYRDLQTKKNSMLKEMKATREQRVKRYEDSKHSFTGWVVHLINNPELTKSYGLEMERMRLAMEKEGERLGQFHQYEDGEVDQPFLTPDTVME
tara:strand:+ start:3016 stop:3801 length:786 start_codon:yes stop_codon:yes gene_type:complete